MLDVLFLHVIQDAANKSGFHSPPVLDLDSFAEWSPSFMAAQEKNASESVRKQMAETPPDLLEEALQKLFDLATRENVVAATLNWIRSKTIAAYHGSRLTDLEAVSVKTNGLIPLEKSARRVRLKRALSRHRRWSEVADKLDSLIATCAIGREGRVTLAFSRSALTDDYNHYLTHGSEFDQCVAEHLLGQEGLDLLAIDGRRTLIQVAVPGATALDAANPHRTADEIAAQGEIPQLAKELLEVWSYSLAYPGSEHRFSISCDMAIVSVPSAWIASIKTFSD